MLVLPNILLPLGGRVVESLVPLQSWCKAL
jgi:hypothetical protein